ncbi:putative coenzyme A-disulfide reductase [Tetragenococcus halophilus subsp. halophilus]|uniref:Coenzyme A-disulfide reductase n=1 Tax=Tetragenococcus halophilus (strain DSM 20338 / JCM 20259 / NCIMB 9735 / NBRC 12172) TaxID=945021 RepID=A0AAN1SJN6_TETHN|nr:FAD-dependent oxidoreductase [Tetragenococcus halophilus]MDN6162395.1 FAD-dependent oxidoreductase [Atopostipes sp.]MCO7026042.1 FAD-dependent oxidoreductase [Tetragenococcus halophilus]NWN99782.1 FAD-dependent oxidoreductase [Tetragenococcus halophilus]BAK95353.1 putative coenzyme A-disulfide reductase [Tetragenococcus halophilus NBRC 12172]GBD71737.1 putative coenzyme A-disulfide reductase [Tetragenococcus halophilus subsp. halophilus]
MKVIIIGGVAGGMSAATRLRRLKEDAEIIVLEKGPNVSFANCGLPYYISGEIANRDQLLVQTPEKLKARFNIDVRPNNEVLQILPSKKSVLIKGEDENYEETYDKLVLSPGAAPITPSIPGIEESSNVHTLRNVTDLDQIMEEFNDEPKNATVVGAGFIGLEMAENLHNRGLNVTIVEKAPQVLPTLDEEMAAFMQNELTSQGVEVMTSNSVAAFKEKGSRLVLEDEQELPTDITILSIGIQPESKLAKEAGLETGFKSGIVVNDNYQTSDPDIYAIGDAITVKQQVTGENTLISLASPANRQGRQVADVIAGLPRKNQGSIGTAIVRAFRLAAASTGLNERTVKQKGLSAEVIHVNGQDHASYYPGSTGITLKLIFHPETGKIYGAQAIGQKGVDKRIDILATAIKGGLTIEDLPELEFTYSPPFGSAKDPVHIAGYTALNIMEGLSHNIQWYELEDAFAKGKILLDVRSDAELTSGQFKNSTHIPLNELRNRLFELDKNKKYIVSCHTGLRSYMAERILKQNGFQVENLDGAFALYKAVRPEKLIYE